MVDENDREGAKGGEIPEAVQPPSGAEAAGETPAESGLDAAADAGAPAAAVPPGDYPVAIKPRGDGIRRWLSVHKIVTVVGIGVLAVALMVGVFFIGYAVGKPANEHDRRVPVQGFQQPVQPDMRQDMQSMPSPGPGEGGQGRFDVLFEYREEIEDMIAAELGISSDELRDELQDGKTVEEIAEEKGVSSEDLTAAVAAEIGRIADELAADGEISDGQAENMKDQADDLAERFVERGSRRFLMPSE
ncbi:MAG: hypothetical protein JW854_16610 [Actinobacteria bacterium]|nr:hypothetical protein [Actinomycetota bacterium]